MGGMTGTKNDVEIGVPALPDPSVTHDEPLLSKWSNADTDASMTDFATDLLNAMFVNRVVSVESTCDNHVCHDGPAASYGIDITLHIVLVTSPTSENSVKLAAPIGS